jgi:hypothetical protein
VLGNRYMEWGQVQLLQYWLISVLGSVVVSGYGMVRYMGWRMYYLLGDIRLLDSARYDGIR